MIASVPSVDFLAAAVSLWDGVRILFLMFLGKQQEACRAVAIGPRG